MDGKPPSPTEQGKRAISPYTQLGEYNDGGRNAGQTFFTPSVIILSRISKRRPREGWDTNIQGVQGSQHSVWAVAVENGVHAATRVVDMARRRRGSVSAPPGGSVRQVGVR